MNGCPIDWADDFDYFEPGFVENPYPVWNDLRQQCPVAHTERHGGSWMPTTYELIAQVAYDTDHFSSRDVAVVGAGGSGLLVAPPITSDPPFHTAARRLLLPAFAPRPIDELTPMTESIAHELLDVIVERGRGDAAIDYAQHLPVRVISHMLGVPADLEATFTTWVRDLFQSGPADAAIAKQAARDILQFFRAQVEHRRNDGGDDLISLLLDATLNGDPLTEKHVLGTCFLLLVAGIDTTWSSIGSSLWHLATHPADRDRLVADPSLIPTAVEEFLRAYAPVTMARVVDAPTELGGHHLDIGDRVLLPFPAGNRDPSRFDGADEVRIDRDHNRHFAFGIGVHRCLGSNLARMELAVAVRVWLERLPTFRLADDATVEWTGGQVRGPRSVPITVD